MTAPSLVAGARSCLHRDLRDLHDVVKSLRHERRLRAADSRVVDAKLTVGEREVTPHLEAHSLAI